MFPAAGGIKISLSATLRAIVEGSQIPRGEGSEIAYTKWIGGAVGRWA